MYGRLVHLIGVVLVLGFMCAGAYGDIGDGLVALWPLEEGEGTAAADASGNGSDGALNAGVSWATGLFGGALEFDGTDDHVDCGNPPILDFGTGDFTVSAWINTTMAGKGTVYAKGADNSGGVRYTLCVGENNDGRMTLTTDNNSDKAQAQGATLIDDGQWHLVMGIRSGDTSYVYVDGVEDASANLPAGYDLSGTSQANTYIGAIDGAADAGSVALEKFFAGLIDDVAVWDRALTVEEIELLWNGGAGNPVDQPEPGQASGEFPADGAADVPRDTVLSWEPGEGMTAHDVYFGTVLDDVSNASRTNPLDMLASQGQTETTYDPGRLEFEQTYYWRIDEVDGATIVAGEVWSFTVEPLAYALEGVVATTNAASTQGQGPENAVDGSGLGPDDGHSVESTTMWTAALDPDQAQYIQFDFDRVYKMHEMIVWNHNMSFEFLLGIGIKEATLDYSSDGTEWMTLGDIELAQAPGNASYTGSPVSLEGIAAKAVRLTVKSTYGTSGQLGLSEVRFLYIPVQPREPEPADGATEVDVTTALSWRAGRDAASHDIYLSDDPNALERVATTTEAGYAASLDYGTTYSWQVVEVNEAEAVTAWDGDVWTFSTEEYRVIDDFESYIDDPEAGDVVWEIWIDGLVEYGGDAANGGGVVGNDTSPFCEQTTVHGGDQSMPFFFSGAISEADRRFSPAEDWIANGLKSLSLWFYGPATNTGQLYVKINDQKVPYPGDAGDIAKAMWLPFNVDLSTIGGAANVTEVSIGVDNAGDGENVLYIDDIRLYPAAPEYITPAEPGTDGLLTHLAFDDGSGTIAADSSGNGHGGSLVNSPQWVAGMVDGALQFGQGSHVLDDDAEDYLNGLEALTICAWIKSNVVDTDQGVLICQEPADADETIGIRYDAAGATFSGTNVLKVAVTSTEDVQQVESSSNLQTTDWQHICMTWESGGLLRLYVNGIEDALTGRSNPNTPGAVSTCENLIIGKGAKDLLPNVGWDGLVDDVRIYNVALSPAEILWLNGETEPRPKPF